VSNPYAAPAAAPGGIREVPVSEVPSPALLGTIMLAQVKDGPAWRLALGQDEAWLVPPDGNAYHLTHEAFAEHATLLSTQSVMMLTVRNVPGRGNVVLNGRAESQSALTTWLAQRGDVHARGALKKRLAYTLPVGALIAVLAISNTPLNPFSLAGGIAMMAIALVARWRPHPILILADAGVWGLLAASNALRASQTGSTTSVVFVVLCAFFMFAAAKNYMFYRSLTSR